VRQSRGKRPSKHNYKKIDIDIINPGKCQTDLVWDVWQIALMNKLNATMGAAKVPVVYVIWADNDDDYEFDDKEEEWMHQPNAPYR
jgi:hypothetical protein